MPASNNSEDSSSESSSDSEFESKSQAEDMEDYKLDGYHPVSIGESFNNAKYTVIQKLGWGHFSTVWLVNEKKTNSFSALKIQKSKKSYFEAAMDELQICEHLNKQSENPDWKKSLEEYTERFKEQEMVIKPDENFVIRLCDNFVHYGMHGKHPCSVFEVMGPNLLDLIQHFEFNHKFCDIWLVKHICIQILLGLDYTHRICNVIHTDLKPENVMFALDHLELEDFVKDLQNYKKKPLSMKFLKFLKNKLGQASNKNKKKYQKKKNKKKNKGEPSQPSEIVELKQSEEFEKNPDTGGFREQKPSENDESKKKSEESKQITTPVELKEGESKNEEKAKHENNENLNKETDNKIEEKSKEGNKEDLGKLEENNKSNLEGTGISTKSTEEEKKTIESPLESKKTEYDPKVLRWKDHVLIHLDKTIRIKLVDFGNACWTNKHFTDRIQTREYRSPEAILGIEYTATTDMWSFACMVFELLTNTFLFKPRKGEDYGKNEDHLALMIETLGKIPKNFALSGKKSRKFFNKNGQLIRIKNIKEYRIKDILAHDFSFEEREAAEIEEFLLPMLEYDPKKRIDARTALQSKWLWS